MDSRSSIAQEAAEWFLELSGAGSRRRAEFLDWLRRSPEHVREFLAVSSLSRRLKGVDPHRCLDVKQLLASPGSEVIRLADAGGRSEASPNHRRARRRSLLAVAATLAVAVSGAWLWLQMRSDVYVTRVGELRSFSLSDGSLIELNTDSRAEVRYSKKDREVELVRGEALFTVQGDAHRPFRVRAGAMAVTAVGTRFNVYRHTGGVVTVAVLQGAVRVEKNAPPDHARAGKSADRTAVVEPVQTALLLKAGEQTSSGPTQPMTKASISESDDVVSWRERQLVFRDTPLKQVASEFNRYNRRRILIDGLAGDERQITGTFAADRPESLIEFLRRDPKLRLSEGENMLVISELD